MKRTLKFSAVALAAFIMTGCNVGGDGGEYSYAVKKVKKSTQRTVGGKTVVTEYSWNAETTLQTGEVQTIDGVTSYTISDFKQEVNDNGVQTITRTRTRTVEGEPVVEKLVTTYGIFGNNSLEVKYEEFLGSGTTPVRYSTTDRDNYGRARVVREFEGETLTLHRWEFNYPDNSDRYTYKEQIAGGAPVAMCYKVTSRDMNGNVTGYEIYSGWDGSDGILVEKATGYKSNNSLNTVEYTITRYDNTETGPVVTNVTEEFVTFNITIKY
jgi:predicted small secreted protein